MVDFLDSKFYLFEAQPFSPWNLTTENERMSPEKEPV